MSRKAIIAAILMSACSSGEALAAGCANFSPANFGTFTWDPFDPVTASNGLTANITFTVTRTNSNTRSVDVDFGDTDDALTPFRVAASGPGYDLLSGTNSVVKHSSSSEPSAPLFTTSHPNGNSSSDSANVTLQLRILAPSAAIDVTNGTYIQTLAFRANCKMSNGSVSGQGTGSAAFTVTVPSSISATLAGGGTSQQVDFVDFASLLKTVNLTVKSTGAYTVLTTSDNGGQMVLQNSGLGSLPANAKLDYQMTLAGTPLTSGSTVSMPRTGIGGAALALNIQVTSAMNTKRAGTYKDHVTFTFTPST